MKIALIQFNPTVGELDANAKRLVDFAQRARAAGAQVAVASELALPGYPPRDLLERRRFVEEIEAVTTRIAAEAPPELTLIFGSVERAGGGTSTLALNQAVVAHGGQIVSRASKQLLPSYDVFDETRHFEPGRATVVHELGGQRLALTVCEDAWASSPAVGARYGSDPLDVLGRAGADVLINLSASPFTLDKLHARPELFSDIARRYQVPVVFVNQVGANDELVFDGRSSVWDANGKLLARAEMFAEDLLLVDLAAPHASRVTPEAGSVEEAAYRALVLGIRDYTRKCGFTRVVLGLSGGIDSALTAVLAADALGPSNVLGLAMPTRYSSLGSIEDARAIAENLGIEFRVVDIDGVFEKYLGELGPVLDAVGAARAGDVTFENLQARIRGTTLMAVSNRTGAMVLTTGNKSEIAVGYCTLYGDMAGGLAAISDLPKTMVYRVSRWINREQERIPNASIEKPPSAELRPDQLDQDSLPPYDELDAVLELYVEDHLGPRDIVERGFPPALVNRVVSLVRGSEYKRRQAAPGLIITRKAFGLGRRVPLAQRFSERV